MPNVIEEFPHLNDYSQEQLLARRSALVGSAPDGNYKDLPDEALKELVIIHRVLRRRTNLKTTTSGAGSRKVVPSLDAL